MNKINRNKIREDEIQDNHGMKKKKPKKKTSDTYRLLFYAQKFDKNHQWDKKITVNHKNTQY